MATKYDYIIVGGGTAGLTVAARLTENVAVTVLVIEAGADTRTDPLVLTPGLFLGMFGNPKYDWNFRSVPQPALHDRIVVTPRGKQLGGSSALNTMMMVYPSRKNIDTWAALGNEGWDFDSLKPYFRKSSTIQAPSLSAKDMAGLTYHDASVVGDGPLKVSFGDGYTNSNSAWTDTFAKFGMEVKADLREGSSAMGAFQQGSSIDPETRTRSYAASAYLSEEIYNRQNLTVVTETVVKKVLFEDGEGSSDPRVRGIFCQSQDGSNEMTFESEQVILAAGALQSPQILELSGIGSQQRLESHGIPVVVDNPFVGENLQDHPIVSQSFEVNDEVPSNDVLRDPYVIQKLLAQYQADHSGPLGQSNFINAYAPFVDGAGVCTDETRAALFARHAEHIEKQADGIILRDLLDSGDEPPIQYLFIPGQTNSVILKPSSLADLMTPTLPENYMTIITTLNHPLGRGSIHIKSNDINEQPAWDPNFGVDPLDTDILTRHVQFVERFITEEPFASLIKPNGARIPDVKGALDDIEKAREIVFGSQASIFHPSGSCGMRPRDKGGVVDARLCVYGVKGLRVVDASVFPLEPLGNIQSVVYAVAEKAADLIKEDHGRS